MKPSGFARVAILAYTKKFNFLPVHLYLVLFHSSTVILPERLVNFPKLTGAASAPRLSGTDEPEIAEMRIPILILANLVF